MQNFDLLFVVSNNWVDGDLRCINTCISELVQERRNSIANAL